MDLFLWLVQKPNDDRIGYIHETLQIHLRMKVLLLVYVKYLRLIQQRQQQTMEMEIVHIQKDQMFLDIFTSTKLFKLISYKKTCSIAGFFITKYLHNNYFWF